MINHQRYKIKNGPPIHVEVVTNHAAIEQVNLSINPSAEFTWEIISNQKIPAEIKNQIQLWLENYGKKKQTAFPLTLDLTHFKPFTKRVLRQIETIPFGNTLSYKEIATLIHKPKAFRAVGNACGSNPYPLFIACHRVISHRQTLGGFSLDLELKRQLLEFENVKLA